MELRSSQWDYPLLQFFNDGEFNPGTSRTNSDDTSVLESNIDNSGCQVPTVWPYLLDSSDISTKISKSTSSSDCHFFFGSVQEWSPTNLSSISQWTVAPTTVLEEGTNIPCNTSVTQIPACLPLNRSEKFDPIESQDILLKAFDLEGELDVSDSGPRIQTNGSPEVNFVPR
jgi:hypothetical protein